MTTIVETIIPASQLNIEVVQVPSSPGGGGGTSPTNLSITDRTATALTINSSTGADAVIPAATPALAGLQTAADKAKSDALGTASTRNVPVTGNASASEVVLGNDSRLSDQRVPTPHGHTIANTIGLQAELDSKQDTLVSGDNIKTINGESILGAGNITVAGSGTVPITFTQPTPTTTWSVSHNLGRYPIIQLKTLGTAEIHGEISHVSVNQFLVLFNNPQAGQAIYF